MKLLFDLFPVILMFAAFKMFDIYVATAVAIGAVVLQIGYLKFTKKPVAPMMWVGAGIIVVAGAATIFFKNEAFIKWKPTILYCITAVVIMVMQFFLNKNPIALMFNNQIKAPDALWRKLSLAWISFFLVMAALNLYVAFNFSTDTWMNFKLFGSFGAMFAFIIAQMFWLYPYMVDESADATPPKI